MTVYGLQPIIIQTETACAAVFKTCEHCVAICCSHVTKSAFVGPSVSVDVRCVNSFK